MVTQAEVEKALNRAVVKAAFDIEAEAVRKAPVDTGRLRASIKVRVEGNTIILSSNVEYDVHQEYGTVKMRAHPFMRPAIFAGVKRFIPKRIKEELHALQTM